MHAERIAALDFACGKQLRHAAQVATLLSAESLAKLGVWRVDGAERMFSCPKTKIAGHLCLQMSSILSLVNDRLSSLESTVCSQQESILHLEYKLDAAQGTAAKMPYLSGRFGYGLGRPAVRREVLLFAKRGQTKRERDEWPTIFIGKHKTDVAGVSFFYPRLFPEQAGGSVFDVC